MGAREVLSDNKSKYREGGMSLPLAFYMIIDLVPRWTWSQENVGPTIKARI
jgi:hypothetical protein